MTQERDALAGWLATVLRGELPIREKHWSLAACADERAGERELPWPTAAWCDGAHVGVNLRLKTPQGEAFRAMPLVAVGDAHNRVRAELFVRAWCASVRRALRDLATSPLPDAPEFTVTDLGTPASLGSVLHRAALTTPDDFRDALSERKLFGRFFAITPVVAGAALDRVHAVLTAKPPIVKTPNLVLRALTTPWNDDPPPGPSRGGVRVYYGGVVAGFELALYGGPSTRGSKQQEIEMVPAEFLGDLARVEGYLRAWRDVLPEHISLLSPDEAAYLMPHDLVNPGVLTMKRAHTRDDFRAAFAHRWQFDARRALRPPKPA